MKAPLTRSDSSQAVSEVRRHGHLPVVSGWNDQGLRDSGLSNNPSGAAAQCSHRAPDRLDTRTLASLKSHIESLPSPDRIHLLLNGSGAARPLSTSAPGCRGFDVEIDEMSLAPQNYVGSIMFHATFLGVQLFSAYGRHGDLTSESSLYVLTCWGPSLLRTSFALLAFWGSGAIFGVIVV